MPNVSQKLKILHLARIFLEQTDEDHGLSTPRLIEELAAVGVSVERKALYRDIDALRAFGLDIETIKGRPVSYALKSRAFTFGELSLIVDAVSSSRFLAEEKAEELIDSIRRLGSRHQASRLAGNVHVDRRVTRQSDSVYANVDALREALRSNRKSSSPTSRPTFAKTGWKDAPGDDTCSRPWRSSTATASITSSLTATSTTASPTTASTAWRR